MFIQKSKYRREFGSLKAVYTKIINPGLEFFHAPNLLYNQKSGKNKCLKINFIESAHSFPDFFIQIF